MGATPDRHPGVLVETEEIQLGGDAIGDPTTPGALRYVGGAFRFCDATGVYDPRESPLDHAKLRQLIHLADGAGGPWEDFTSGAYRETLPAADPFPTNIIWWTDSGKTAKIVEKLLVLNANKTPQTITWSAYADDGVTVVSQIRDTISYSGVFETTRTRQILI